MRPENMPRPPGPENAERPDAIASVEIPKKHEEVLLYEFDQTYEHAVSKSHSDEERKEFHSILHKIAEQFNNQQMLLSYEAGTIPTFHSMELAVAEVSTFLEQFDDEPEANKIRLLLSQRVKEIRKWCSKYEQSVVMFHKMKKRLRVEDDFKIRDDFTRADAERRRIHDNLMQSLRFLDQTIQDANEFERLPRQIPRWNKQSDLPEDFAHEHALIFNPALATNENRDFIKDWALVANLEQKMLALLNYRSAEEKE